MKAAVSYTVSYTALQWIPRQFLDKFDCACITTAGTGPQASRRQKREYSGIFQTQFPLIGQTETLNVEPVYDTELQATVIDSRELKDPIEVHYGLPILVVLVVYPALRYIPSRQAWLGCT